MKYLLVLALAITVVHGTDYSIVKFTFVGNTVLDTQSVSSGGNFGALAGTQYFQSTRKTVIYFNSWRQKYDSNDATTIFNAYLTRRAEWNIIYCDWSKYTDNFVFIPSLQALDGVANTIKNILTEMNGALFSPTPNIHLVGFGIGAHLAGYVGRKFSVSRITGLDPMGCFMYTNIIFGFAGVSVLGKFDAPFVDVIHTSAGKFGYPSSMGHLDFWVNGGISQNGCTFIQSIRDFINDQRIENIYVLACSHVRAVYLYAESVIRSPSPKPFVSSMCGLLTSNYNPTECSNNVMQVSMGYHAAVPNCGFNILDCQSPNYYVATNAAPTFSLT